MPWDDNMFLSQKPYVTSACTKDRSFNIHQSKSQRKFRSLETSLHSDTFFNTGCTRVFYEQLIFWPASSVQPHICTSVPLKKGWKQDLLKWRPCFGSLKATSGDITRNDKNFSLGNLCQDMKWKSCSDWMPQNQNCLIVDLTSFDNILRIDL